MHNQDLDNEMPIRGWCPYCKEIVSLNEEYVRKAKHIYHLKCYNQMNDFEEELNFDHQ